MDPRVAGYLQKNKEWARSSEYKAPIVFGEMQRKGRAREDGTIIIVACTDPRVTPEEYLGMDEGTKATVVRVAGGRVHAAMNSLLVLAAVGNNGTKGVIMVVHHTDCGLVHVTDEDIVRTLKANTSSQEEQAWLENMKFGSFEDPDNSVKEDVKILQQSSFFKGMQILGLVQDTQTGILKEVLSTADAT